MKTYATISMDYNKSVKKAEELESLAERLENIAGSKLSEALQELSGEWKGQSADTFIRKGESLSDQIRQSAKQLYKTAEIVRTIASNTRNAEINALEIARNRTYR